MYDNLKKLMPELERLIKQHGSMSVSFDRGGSGMGLYFSATIGYGGPYGSGSILEDALEATVRAHLRREREEIQTRINEIDQSAML